MSFIGLEFNSASNPITTARFISLSNASVSDVLIIHQFPDESGYQNDLLGWVRGDGRSLTGSLKVIGAGYLPKPKWQISAVINLSMLHLFTELLRAQKESPITLIDKFEKIEYISGIMPVPNWISGYPVTNSRGKPEGYAAHNVVLDVDTGYKTWQSPSRILLQFQANLI